MKKTFYILPINFYLQLNLYADLPLEVESIVSEKGKFQFLLNTFYINIKSSKPSLSEYIPLQLQNQSGISTSIINIPTGVSNEEIQNESLVTTLGIKYGILKI